MTVDEIIAAVKKRAPHSIHREGKEPPWDEVLVAEVEKLRENRKPVTGIRICKVPYQEHPFVHGARDGHDVWLLSDGQWTEDEDHPDADIPLYGDISIVGLHENVEIESLRSKLDDARHGIKLAESETDGKVQEIERLQAIVDKLPKCWRLVDIVVSCGDDNCDQFCSTCYTKKELVKTCPVVPDSRLWFWDQLDVLRWKVPGLWAEVARVEHDHRTYYNSRQAAEFARVKGAG